MSELSKLQAELDALCSERNEILDRIISKKRELAALCSVKVGDEAEVNGHAHTGKTIKVEHVNYYPQRHHYSGNITGSTLYRCTGPIILKDGSLSKTQSGKYWSN